MLSPRPSNPPDRRVRAPRVYGKQRKVPYGPSNVVVGAFTPRLPSSRVEGKARAPSASRRSWGSGNQMSEASVRALAAVRPLDEEIAMLDDAERHRPRTPDPFEEDGNIRSLSPESSSSLPPPWYRRLSSSLAPRSNRAVASVRFLGFDERGWQMLRVPGKAVADGTTQIFQVTVGDKTVELVQQQDPMKVYVNPRQKALTNGRPRQAVDSDFSWVRRLRLPKVEASDQAQTISRPRPWTTSARSAQSMASPRAWAATGTRIW